MHDRILHPEKGTAVEALGGVVDVWRVDLREVGKEPLRLLAVEERRRAGAIANPGRRALWMRGRGVLRLLLGGYLERHPRELQFVVGKHGKPALAGVAPGGPSGGASAGELHFNVSHSGPMALYAFTAAAPVGVDLELARKRGAEGLDKAALGERTFGPEVGRRLRELDAPARGREFLRLWVRREAALKCLGTGLFGAEADAEADAAEPWVAELDLGPGVAGAVAVQGGPRELRLRDWPAQPQ
jgi:4'-phosphopantetheinyl transferase